MTECCLVTHFWCPQAECWPLSPCYLCAMTVEWNQDTGHVQCAVQYTAQSCVLACVPVSYIAMCEMSNLFWMAHGSVWHDEDDELASRVSVSVLCPAYIPRYVSWDQRASRGEHRRSVHHQHKHHIPPKKEILNAQALSQYIVFSIQKNHINYFKMTQ